MANNQKDVFTMTQPIFQLAKEYAIDSDTLAQALKTD